MELDSELRKELIKFIKEGKQIPASYRNLLFELDQEQAEYELIYGCKEREEDILSDTMAVPFQLVKQFGKAKEGEWVNKLIFGDNLQALKYLKKLQDEGKLEKIKLIFIDPPFGTGDIYDAQGAPAYSAALQGAKYLEFLRKRLIFLRELLADDGSIYVRIDYHYGHYVKVLMDEIFGKNNFRNEIVINRTKAKQSSKGNFTPQTDSLFFYTKGKNYTFNQLTRKIEPMWNSLLHFPRASDKPRKIQGKLFYPPKNRRWALSQENIDKFERLGKTRINKKITYVNCKGEKIKGMPELLYDVEPIRSDWLDIPGYSQRTHYPTENAEEVLERIIKASSNPGDLVLDCFAGSGTTGAVAEKLGRKWIMVDVGKLSIYTIIKRMHNLKREIGNKGKSLKPKPFALYNAGLYEDHGFILKIGEDKYKKFAMELFQVEPKENYEINGLQMDGVLFNCPVKVFSQKGFLTEEYIDELHATVGDSIKARMFIIAPASRVYFLEDYIEKAGIRYYILRIPYSVIDELHKVDFSRPIQPNSLKQINQNIDAIGFDFNHPPKVKVDYYKIKPKDKLAGYMGGEELVIEIKNFEAVQRSKNPIEFRDPKDALSMVLIDIDYNNKFFNMTHYFFADEINKNNWKIRISNKNIGKKLMIIYIDIFGNERKEVITSTKFKRK